MEPHRHRAELFAALERCYARPSLYDEAIRLLARRGFAIDPRASSATGRPYTLRRVGARRLGRGLPRYRAHWELYELAEKLVDLEDAFRQWRFRHVTTVERIIGLKRGTGGTSGVGYLRGVVETELFPELWRARTEL
jgi:tryptophan 2,3-dioxygenase